MKPTSHGIWTLLFKTSGQISWRIIFSFLRSQLSCHWPSFWLQLNYKVWYVDPSENRMRRTTHGELKHSKESQVQIASRVTSHAGECTGAWSSLLSSSSPSLTSWASQLLYHDQNRWHSKIGRTSIKTLSSLGV
jgi:hypothetical protein